MRRWQQLDDAAAPSAKRSHHRLEVRYQCGPGLRQELEALAAAEQQCCAFVTWTVTEDADQLVLHVAADPKKPDDVAPIADLFGATQ